MNGTGFVNGAGVQFNGANRVTTFVSGTQVTAVILASDIAAAGTANVAVTNPAPTTGASASLALNISSGSNPVPAISTLGTNHVTGGAAFTLTVNGSSKPWLVPMTKRARPTTRFPGMRSLLFAPGVTYRHGNRSNAVSRPAWPFQSTTLRAATRTKPSALAPLLKDWQDADSNLRFRRQALELQSRVPN